MKKWCFIALLTLYGFKDTAKVISVKIGVNGLTCAQCTRNVEMQIRKLGFVQDVVMNLENTEGVITFKENERVNFHKIAKAVVDAGFNVRFLSSEIKIETEDLADPDVCYTLDGAVFNFTDFKKARVGDTINILFLGKEYQGKKDAQKWKDKIKPACKQQDKKEVYSVAMV